MDQQREMNYTYALALQAPATPNVFAAYTTALDERTRQFMEEALAHSQGGFPVQWLQTFIRRMAAKDMELQDRERQLSNMIQEQHQRQYQSHPRRGYDRGQERGRGRGRGRREPREYRPYHPRPTQPSRSYQQHNRREVDQQHNRREVDPPREVDPSPPTPHMDGNEPHFAPTDPEHEPHFAPTDPEHEDGECE